jgi:hypothetical protein
MPPTDRRYTQRDVPAAVELAEGSAGVTIDATSTRMIHEAITWRRAEDQIALIGEQSLELMPDACSSIAAQGIESPVNP